MENESAFKHIYNEKLLIQIAEAMAKTYPDFDKKSFIRIKTKMLKLEMKDRVRLIRDTLFELLPSDYEVSLDILLSAVTTAKLSGFSLWPFTEFVQTYGHDHQKKSFAALTDLTKLFTSEWAIRPFIIKDTESSLEFLLRCAKDDNHHLRRFASEGSRPRLPWGERLQVFIDKPHLTLPILDQLKFDSELYVRKSVANHLNDIAKDHPDLVIKTLSSWKKRTKTIGDEKHLEWIIRHSLRSLIKAGNSKALKLIGVDDKTKVSLNKFSLKRKKIKLGESLDFSFEINLKEKKEKAVVIDYIIHFVKANKKTAPKVFKLKSMTLKPNQIVSIKKSHKVMPITTRVYYPGKHFVEIQINGQKLEKKDWTLIL